MYQKLERSIIGSKKRDKNNLVYEGAEAATKAETCYYCHGTKLKVIGSETRDTEAAGAHASVGEGPEALEADDGDPHPDRAHEGSLAP